MAGMRTVRTHLTVTEASSRDPHCSWDKPLNVSFKVLIPPYTSWTAFHAILPTPNSSNTPRPFHPKGLCTGCSLEHLSPPPFLANSYSFFALQLKCHLLQEASSDATIQFEHPVLDSHTLLCSPLENFSHPYLYNYLYMV